jgi:hypothetical protein
MHKYINIHPYIRKYIYTYTNANIHTYMNTNMLTGASILLV